MSNPRYTPRSFVVPPRDFGRRRVAEWIAVDPSWTPRERARFDASRLQHEIAFGVLEIYLPASEIRTITALAGELGMPYGRLQQMLNGQIVMQMEDLSRLRAYIGDDVDAWVTTANAGIHHQASSM